MKLLIDTLQKKLEVETEANQRVLPLYSREAFELLSLQWVKVGWDQKYAYAFSWMGRPIIQLPEDMIRVQEVVYRLKPSVIVETGVAHGGSLVYYASLCKAMGKGRVIGVDVHIKKENRQAIETHEMASSITLIEGDSVSPEIVKQVKALIRPDDSVLVLLDSCHTKAHVTAELEAYHRFVTFGSYIVATDGVMKDLNDVPRGNPSWQWDHPVAAAELFVKNHPDFVLEQPTWPFKECELTENVTHWPSSWLRKTKCAALAVARTNKAR